MDTTDVYNELIASLSAQADQSVLVRKLIISILLAVLFWIANKMVVRFIQRQNLTPQARFRWTRVANYLIPILGIFTIGAVWWEFFGSLATLLGLVLAGIAVALRDPIANIAGWAYIVWRKPFGLGDRVEVDQVRGDVADIDPFIFTLAEVRAETGAEQPTGRLIHVPNSFVFTKHIANATQGFEYVWDEIPVVVTFESDWEEAKSLLQATIEKHTGQFTPAASQQVDKATMHYMLQTSGFDPRVFTNVIDIGVELTMRYVVEVRNRRIVREAIWEEILRVFAQHPELDFAYPTQRLYFNQQEAVPVTNVTPAPPAAQPS